MSASAAGEVPSNDVVITTTNNDDDDVGVSTTTNTTKHQYPLRVTCYGSSSSKTPTKYLTQAYELGKTLALRGHTCVNGAGAYGCMAAMNDGASDHGGNIVGVIHEMFVVDGNDWLTKPTDTGSHGAFLSSTSTTNDKKEADLLRAEYHRELLVAKGDDLQERKRLLIDGADALVVLPGGPGTWDELMEMACARNLGLVELPIVCINVDKYYDPFRNILQRAYEDELIKLLPHDIVHFVDTAIEAVRHVEEEVTKLRQERKKKEVKKRPRAPVPRLKKRSSSLFFGGEASILGDAMGYFTGGILGTAGGGGGGNDNNKGDRLRRSWSDVSALSDSSPPTQSYYGGVKVLALTFVTGIAMGLTMAKLGGNSSSRRM